MIFPTFGRAFRGLVLSAAAVGMVSPALAHGDQVQPGSERAKRAEQEAAAAEQPKKICTMETKTGSNMPRRVCRTLSAKDLEAMEHEQEMRRANDAQRTQMGGPL